MNKFNIILYGNHLIFFNYLSIIFILLCLNSLTGCDRSSSPKNGKINTSTNNLLMKLPNLKSFDIESCEYTLESSTASSRVPSPSDTRIEMTGSFIMSGSDTDSLKSGFNWISISRDEVPTKLLTELPPGEILVSKKLNKSFSNNPSMAHGFIVVLVDDNFSKAYFIATDMDHPIK